MRSSAILKESIKARIADEIPGFLGKFGNKMDVLIECVKQEL